MPRLALIHALSHSVSPINAQLDKDWPGCSRMNLLDDSLSADLAASGRGLDDTMHQRFEDLAAYAERTGANGILFTCSAFGPCIEAVARRRPHMPVLKPNEAMIADAAALMAQQANGTLGLLATFGPTLQSMPAEFPPEIALRTKLAEGALQALNKGDVQQHDALIVQAAVELRNQGCSAIALAQFSIAHTQGLIAQATGLPVLSTPASAVKELRQRILKTTPAATI